MGVVDGAVEGAVEGDAGLLLCFAVVFELEDIDLQRLLVLAHLRQDDGAGLEEIRVYTVVLASCIYKQFCKGRE